MICSFSFPLQWKMNQFLFPFLIPCMPSLLPLPDSILQMPRVWRTIMLLWGQKLFVKWSHRLIWLGRRWTLFGPLSLCLLTGWHLLCPGKRAPLLFEELQRRDLISLDNLAQVRYPRWQGLFSSLNRSCGSWGAFPFVLASLETVNSWSPASEEYLFKPCRPLLNGL